MIGRILIGLRTGIGEAAIAACAVAFQLAAALWSGVARSATATTTAAATTTATAAALHVTTVFAGHRCGPGGIGDCG